MAARDLADSLQLSDQEKKALKKSIVDVVENTPQATVAASRFKQLVTKGGQWAADGFREILVGVISDVAKKQMGL